MACKFEGLEGIVSAIEAEASAPHPSHQNLARLCGMFCRALVACMKDDEREACVGSSPMFKAETVTSSSGTVEVNILSKPDADQAPAV